jgi:hypothetical protein
MTTAETPSSASTLRISLTGIPVSTRSLTFKPAAVYSFAISCSSFSVSAFLFFFSFSNSLGPKYRRTDSILFKASVAIHLVVFPPAPHPAVSSCLKFAPAFRTFSNLEKSPALLPSTHAEALSVSYKIVYYLQVDIFIIGDSTIWHSYCSYSLLKESR